MGLLGGIARLLGESLRIKRGESQTANMDAQTRAMIEQTIADAQAGNLNSMYELASWYYKGEYVGYDPQKACEWWTAAAERGHVDSQYNLGLLYLGDTSSYYYDPSLAGYWLDKAASNGDQEAYDLLCSKFRYSNFSNKWKLK